MRNNDAKLIERILEGDDVAFASLVRKYQKRVHALAWRKIGDFHIAEDITQETFLLVYRNLAKLKDRSQFPGWLYVIANRRCLAWLRKKRDRTQPLEEIDIAMTEGNAYSRHVAAEQAESAAETKREMVKNLLAKLKESDRTVLTLYYFGGMTYAEISEFLGVSVNTVAMRVHRARERLKKYEPMIREALGSFQLSPNLTEDIMREIPRIKPLPPTGGKTPIVPWAIVTSTVVLVVLMLGISNQYLVRFQQPYSFDATSEMTVEIIDAPVVIDLPSKPDVRNQAGRAIATVGKSRGTDLQISETLLRSTVGQDAIMFTTSQWTQASGPQGSYVSGIFAASEGTLYAATSTYIYRLSVDAAAWTPINPKVSTSGGHLLMAEHGDTLYIVSPDKIYSSTDNGKTWSDFSSRPEGRAVGLIITDKTQKTRSRVGFTMYLALENRGVFRSIDAGAQWDSLNDKWAGKSIRAVAAIENIMFVGTNEGLYRLNINIDVWERVLVEPSKTALSIKNDVFANKSIYYNAIHSLVTSENNLYVGIGGDIFTQKSSERISTTTSGPGWIFRSTDLGESWTEITPVSEPPVFWPPYGVRLFVAGDTLLTQGLDWLRSTDAGETWTQFTVNNHLSSGVRLQDVEANETTFYTAGTYGIYRTTDGGESWHPLMDGIVGTKMQSLVAFNDRLYMFTGHDIVQSTDGGESWKSVYVDSGGPIPAPIDKKLRRTHLSSESKLVIADGNLYGITVERFSLRIFRLSKDGDVLVPIQGMPAIDVGIPFTEPGKTISKAEGIHLPGDIGKSHQLTGLLHSIAAPVKAGGFAVSNGTFYVEYKRQLLKWKSGNPEWTNTGLMDLGKQPNEDINHGFNLAVSGETIYVGKRDGQLFQSLDGGNNWKNITPILPLRFTRFNEIVFMGSTVYVATDKGVLTSQNGERWRVIANGIGERIVIDRFAVDGIMVYGAGDIGVYRLDTGSKCEQIAPTVPDKTLSLVVDNDKLCIATEHRGMFHISLEEKY